MIELLSGAPNVSPASARCIAIGLAYRFNLRFKSRSQTIQLSILFNKASGDEQFIISYLSR
ncbi:MAG: hypothetical protein AUG51_07965 [Acidobacteria bacterium 13_1_20CM_3_53_8]|nr:MAG: hypothetical protein AUG51_07965 [Acidobacteria bacterium 13_1_20CM_3_53_8]